MLNILKSSPSGTVKYDDNFVFTAIIMKINRSNAMLIIMLASIFAPIILYALFGEIGRAHV